MERIDSQSVEEKLKFIETKLQEYVGSKCIGQDKTLNQIEITQYLSMDRKSLRALSEEDCGEIAFQLNRLSLEIQREVNTQSAVEHWANTQVNKEIAPNLQNYKGYGEEKKYAAIRDNVYAKKAFEVQTHAAMRMKALSYMAQEIKNMANTILDIKRTKRTFQGQA